MTFVKAEFDGRVFVPAEPIDLPTGTTVEVLIPGSPRRPTDEDHQEWQEVLKELASSDPAFPTVEEALQLTRKRS